MRKLKLILLSISLIAIGTIGYYGYSVYRSLDHFNKSPKDSRFTTLENLNTKSPTATPPKWEGNQRVNILLLGGDSRGLRANEIPRSDSMMIVSIEPNTKKAIMFSILRDTYVKIPGYGEDRINAALAYGGPNLAMKTVGDLMGIPIQYYVYTDFKGFISVVDAVGGIDIDVEKNMKYSDGEDDHIYDIDLKKGLQHMDGKTALQYVRFRHDAQSDFGRADRQRKFLQALAGELQSTTGLLKLPSILSAIDPYIETNISVSEMLKLGRLGYEAKASGLTGQQIPPNDLLDERSIRGMDVVTTNPDKLKKFVQQSFIQSIQSSTDAASPSSSPAPAAQHTAVPSKVSEKK